MITSKSDNAREGFACSRQTWLMGIGKRLAHENTVVAFLDLLNSPRVVIAAREICPSALTFLDIVNLMGPHTRSLEHHHSL